MKRQILLAVGIVSLMISQSAFAETPEEAVESARHYVSRFPVPRAMDVSKVTHFVESYLRASPEPSYMVWFLGPASDGCDSNSFGVVVSIQGGDVLQSFDIPENHSSGPFRSTFGGWSCYYDNGPGGGT